jgi:hypothetical protein
MLSRSLGESSPYQQIRATPDSATAHPLAAVEGGKEIGRWRPQETSRSFSGFPRVGRGPRRAGQRTGVTVPEISETLVGDPATLQTGIGIGTPDGGHQRPALPGDPAHHKPFGPGVVRPSASPAGRLPTPRVTRLTVLLPLEPTGEARRLDARCRGREHRLIVFRGAAAGIRHPPRNHGGSQASAHQRDREKSPWS